MDLSSFLGSLGKSGLGGSPGEHQDLMKQAENMLKMLDDMADNDPEGYQKFIQGNLKQGKEFFEKEQQELAKKYTFSVEGTPALSLTFSLSLTSTQPDGKDQKPLSSGIASILSTQPHKALPKEGVLFLNIFSHSKLVGIEHPSLSNFIYRLTENSIAFSADIFLSPDKCSAIKNMTQEWKKTLGMALDRVQYHINKEMSSILKKAISKNGTAPATNSKIKIDIKNQNQESPG